MSNGIDQEIHDLLTDIYQFDTEGSHDQSHPSRTLNIYIDVEEAEEEVDQLITIDGTLDESQPTTTTTNEANTSLATEQPPSSNYSTKVHCMKHQRRPHPAILLFLTIPLVGILAGIAYAVLVPLWTPSANVTIVTQSQQLTNMSTLQLVTNGTIDPTKNQVPGRTLPTITMSRQKTIPTTGTTHQAAQVAHGSITFYNAAPYVQMIEAGTLLTGADGVQVITDQTATVPAAIMPTEGQVYVYGHAALPGTQGNIEARDVYGACCRLNMFVANGAFHGGQDTKTYQSVTQRDINSVTTTIKTSLEQSVQAALQAQVQASETLITPLTCTSKVTPNHSVGEEAIQVQVILSETCTGTTYNTQAVTNLAIQRATQDAEKRIGKGYTTIGIQTRTTQAQATNHSPSNLQVQSSSLWAYPFSQEQQESIKALIAGMSKDRATATVLHMSAVQSVSITIENGTTIPNDVRQIHLLFLQV